MYGRHIGLGRSGNYISRPPLLCRSFKVMFSNVNLVKYYNCSYSDVLMYVSVKDYSFRGFAMRQYAHTPVRSYEGPFPPQAGIFLDTNSIPLFLDTHVHEYQGIMVWS